MESFDTWNLVSLSPLPLAAVVAVCAAVSAGVFLACWGVRQERSAKRRWMLWALRLCAGAAALFVVLEPGLRRLKVAAVKNRVAVLVDRSASMRFATAPKALSRSEATAQALEALAPQMERLKEQYAFEVLGFEPELRPLAAERIRAEVAQAGKTDLLGALRSLQATQSGGSRKLAGVLIFSDGADNTELASGLSERHQAFLEQLGVPISAVAVGTDNLPDVAVSSIQTDDFAFVRNSVTALVEVRARGFEGRHVQVVLRTEGHVIGTKSVSFSSDDDAKTVPFTWTPDQTGRFVYTVSVPVLPEEAVEENNERSFVLKVIRDRIRVLLIAGRPSWDERFLRGILKQDANVELISFYILRQANEPSGAANEERELSLIPFPRDEIFREKLSTFDVVIVVNFSNDEPQTSLAMYQDDLETYVSMGGAVAYLGGDRSFGEAKGRRDPFRNVLPVEASGGAELAPFSARLTTEGLRHPITALGTGSEPAQAVWAMLPKIPGMNLTRPKAEATVLLDHPFATVEGRNAPLLAVAEVGRGRSLALTTDGSWYWAFPSHAAGAPKRTYERFWQNAIRWLVRDPELTSLSVALDSPSVEPGKAVGLSLVARLPDYQPASGANISVELLSAEGGRSVAKANAVAGPDGAARLEFSPPPAGSYKVVARAFQQEKLLGEVGDVLAVRAVGPELADARVNSALLQKLAKSTGGAFFESTSFSLSAVPLLKPPLVEVGRAQDEPLWDRWYWLVAVVGLMGMEWIVRRRWGYI